LGKLLLRKYNWGYASNFDENIFGVQKASLNMFWEYSANLASDWLRVESSLVDEKEKEKNG